MRSWIVCLTTLLIGAVMTIPAVAQTIDSCYSGDLQFTNTSATEQILFVGLLDPSTGKIAREMQPTVTLAPNESFDETVEFSDDDRDDLVLVYGTTQFKNGQTPTGTTILATQDVDPCSLFADGRLNGRDAAAPATIYNVNNTAFDFFGVNSQTGNGTRIMRISLIDIQAAIANAQTSGTNLLIREAAGVSVYALASGTCQMNVFQPDGKLYEFEWECNLASTEVAS
jgi:hypothetical protein